MEAVLYQRRNTPVGGWMILCGTAISTLRMFGMVCVETFLSVFFAVGFQFF